MRHTSTATPTSSGIAQRLADFGTLAEALDYAATGATGCNFHSARGDLTAALPYAELRQRAHVQARRLRGLGLERGDRVGLIAQATPDFVAGFFACQYAALLPVPLAGPAAFGDPDAHRDQIVRQLIQCGARLLLVPDDLAERLREGLAPGFGITIMGWERLAEAVEPADELPEPFRPDDPCYLQYSSGSTRFPTGVEVSQRGLMANCRASSGALGVMPEDRTVTWLPLYHDMGLIGTLLTSISTQVSVDLLAPEDFARRPVQWLRLIARNGGTVSYSPCFGYELALRRIDREELKDLDLSRWRVAGIGGEMIRPSVLAAFVEQFAPAGFRPEAFLPSYGLAEATLGVSFAPLGRGLSVDTVARRPLEKVQRAVPAGIAGGRSFVRCGRPLPGLEVEIRDSRGRALPERRVGRVFVRGPSVMTRYFGDALATGRVLSHDGWLDTGDQGYWAEGELVVVGRAKDCIIINGRNVWPQDLEWTVERLPGLRSQDCAAFAVPTESGGEAAVLLIQCRSRDAAERAGLVAAARQAIRRSCGIDCEIVLVPPKSLPRTSSGKLSRTRARDQYLAGLADGDGRLARRTA